MEDQVRTISDIDTFLEVVGNVSFNVSYQKGFFQLIHRSEVSLHASNSFDKIKDLHACLIIKLNYVCLHAWELLLVRTWDGSNGWSANSNTESTKASNIFTEAFLMLLEASICTGTCRNSLTIVCSYIKIK